MKMTIGKKMMGGFLGVSLLLGAISLISIFGMQKVENSYSDLVDRRSVILANAKDIQTGASREISGLRGVLLGEEGSEEILNEAYTEINDELESILPMVQRPEVKEQLKELDRLNEEFERESRQVIALMQDNKVEARRLANETAIPIAREVRDIADTIDNDLQKNMDTASKSTSEMVNGVQALILFLSIASFIISIVVGIYITRKIKFPILMVEAAAHRVADGDLTQEDIQVKNKDELGNLADAFNQMKLNLRELVQQVSHSADQVSSTSEELSASSEQTSQATELISRSIQGIAAGSEAQASYAKEVEQATLEITSSMGQASSSVQAVSELTADANGKAKAGNQVVHKTVEQMSRVQETVQGTSRVVDTVGQKSVEIGQIVDLITQIADQTNLLALNAAIEAARAGEHGKGFAVVADEVRKLAEQSGQAAKQIGHLVKEIQSEASRAVESMNNGTAEVERGRDLVLRTGDAFKDILQAVGQVDAESKQVLAIVEMIQESSSSMADKMAGISQITEQSASNTQGVAASAEEQTASMEEVAASAEALSRMSQDLKTSIGRFKV
ncbi:methyl-accepting chemotaxis protein [Peribacillus glennii]|uniref:Methyl-accepting chemotaxis protein n=1 Tax=Peribacillus glennii TaxID=2303991 RepID=A0A372LGG0_9BACI|nr:methyl-accepting chemotaxis protein [Peribacillus glennii]RFU65074.1 methyl-accepting chemotaxis protein [Peribacillus glennii]